MDVIGHTNECVAWDVRIFVCQFRIPSFNHSSRVIQPQTGNSKENGSINTGGGAHIGGHVTAGGDFVGRDKVTTAGSGGTAIGSRGNVAAQPQGVTPEAFLQLLAEMRQLVQQAGLEERKTQTIEADVQVVEEEARSAKPDGDFVVHRLGGVTRILKAAGRLTDAGRKLLPLAEQAIRWGGMLFP